MIKFASAPLAKFPRTTSCEFGRRQLNDSFEVLIVDHPTTQCEKSA
jgi:hypothetical protein